MRLYGLKTCDTTRKALSSLPGATFCDVRADGVVLNFRHWPEQEAQLSRITRLGPDVVKA